MSEIIRYDCTQLSHVNRLIGSVFVAEVDVARLKVAVSIDSHASAFLIFILSDETSPEHGAPVATAVHQFGDIFRCAQNAHPSGAKRQRACVIHALHTHHFASTVWCASQTI